MMFDYIKHFHLYCRDTGLDIRLSFEMPQGYETANGTFDIKTKTVFINAEYLNEARIMRKLFSSSTNCVTLHSIFALIDSTMQSIAVFNTSSCTTELAINGSGENTLNAN